MKPAKSYEATKTADYKVLQVSSDAFDYEDEIPSKYTCDGININPALQIDHIPEEAKSLALIVDDPDAPKGTFCHWAIWNIPVTHQIKEQENRGVQGRNDFGQQAYGGPCPPSGTHRYHFNVYALDCILNLPAHSGKQELEQAMSDHVLGFGLLIGTYNRKKK